MAGNGTQGFSGDRGPATSAELHAPYVHLDSAGNMYIADSGNSIVRKVDSISGNISVFAGNGVYSNSGDRGPATSAEIRNPGSMAFDSAATFT